MRPPIHSETVQLIARRYAMDAPRRAVEAAWWHAAGESDDVWLNRIGNADLFGKRHGHQRRLTAAALQAGTAALKCNAGKLKAASDFHTLCCLVEDLFRPIYGLGELAAYDAAERLRYRLGLESKHVIYLHAGARVGARRLAGGRLGREEAWGIHRSGVPEGLRNFSTHDIENMLCMFKDDFLLTPEQFIARYEDGRMKKSACGSAASYSASC